MNGLRGHLALMPRDPWRGVLKVREATRWQSEHDNPLLVAYVLRLRYVVVPDGFDGDATVEQNPGSV